MDNGNSAHASHDQIDVFLWAIKGPEQGRYCYNKTKQQWEYLFYQMSINHSQISHDNLWLEAFMKQVSITVCPVSPFFSLVTVGRVRFSCCFNPLFRFYCSWLVILYRKTLDKDMAMFFHWDLHVLSEKTCWRASAFVVRVNVVFPLFGEFVHGITFLLIITPREAVIWNSPKKTNKDLKFQQQQKMHPDSCSSYCIGVWRITMSAFFHCHYKADVSSQTRFFSPLSEFQKMTPI